MSLFNKLVFQLSLFLVFTINAESQEVSLWLRFHKNNAMIFSDSMSIITSNNQQLNSILKAHSVKSITYPLKSSRKEEINQIVELNCDCDINQLKSDLEYLSGLVKQVEYAPIITSLYTPDDFGIQNYSNYALNLINAEQAWDITHGDSLIEIAIVDANFTISHEELANKYTYFDSLNTNSNYIHGTCVSILAAGNTDNGVGVSSIGFNSKLQLRAMNYNQVLEATYSGAKIINISWTSGCFYNQFIQDVINEVYENGTTIIAAAGNGGTCGGASNLVYPSAHNHVISVTSIGPDNNHERYLGNVNSTHQHNSTVDISAPGYDVLVSPLPGLYLTGNGTSFATPYVSGVVALMLAVNPCLNPDQIEYILKESSMNIDYLNPQYTGLIGAGRLDAYGAVLMAQNYSTFPVSVNGIYDCTDSISKLVLNTDSLIMPYSVHWNNSDTTVQISNILPGEAYSVRVTDGNGCFGILDFTADTLLPLTINSAIEPVSCYGQNDGSVDFSITGGTGNYTFHWDDQSTNSLMFSNLFSGTYMFEVEDQYNCEILLPIEINEPMPLAVNLDYEQISYLYYGQLTTEVFGGTPPYDYSWNNGSSSSSLSVNTAGFYELEIIDSKGCEKSSNIMINSNDIVHFLNFKGDILLQLEEDIQTETISLYPNPVSKGTFFTIDTPFTEFAVFDINSREITHLFKKELNTITFSDAVQSGTYAVKLLMNDKIFFLELVVL